MVEKMLYWLAHFIFNISRIISCESKKMFGLNIAHTFFHRSGISVSWDW